LALLYQKVVTTVKVKNRKLIRFHFSGCFTLFYTNHILGQEKCFCVFEEYIKYVKYFAKDEGKWRQSDESHQF